MVTIRLARFGAKKQPKYRVTVADSRRWRNGRFIEILGHYNPNPRGQEKELILDLGKVDSWVKKGAQPSDRVKRLIKKAQANPEDVVAVAPQKPAPKVAVEKPAAEAPAADA